MERVINAYSFTNEEKNLIQQALLNSAVNLEDEMGHTDHLNKDLKELHDKWLKIYNSF